MNIPQFSAEASVGPSVGIYRGNAGRGFAATLSAVKLQQRFGPIFGGDCIGSLEQCFETFCKHLPFGPQKAKCFAACQQPSVCSDCRCTCSSNCVRTCEREC